MNKLLKCISIILLFFSCEEKIIEKEDLPSTKGCSQQNSYEIIDGILHFKSPEAMSTLVNVLEKMSDEEFFAWEKQIIFIRYIMQFQMQRKIFFLIVYLLKRN